jgi:hypothetical protein
MKSEKTLRFDFPCVAIAIYAHAKEELSKIKSVAFAENRLGTKGEPVTFCLIKVGRLHGAREASALESIHSDFSQFGEVGAIGYFKDGFEVVLKK